MIRRACLVVMFGPLSMSDMLNDWVSRASQQRCAASESIAFPLDVIIGPSRGTPVYEHGWLLLSPPMSWLALSAQAIGFMSIMG